MTIRYTYCVDAAVDCHTGIVTVREVEAIGKQAIAGLCDGAGARMITEGGGGKEWRPRRRT